MSEVVQQPFQLTRKDEFMKSFVKDAISKVVQPMKDSWEEELETVEPTFRSPSNVVKRNYNSGHIAIALSQKAIAKIILEIAK